MTPPPGWGQLNLAEWWRLTLDWLADLGWPLLVGAGAGADVRCDRLCADPAAMALGGGQRLEKPTLQNTLRGHRESA